MHRLVVDGRDVASVEIAATRGQRTKGLLGRTGLTGALWLAPARQVHTFRMKFAIDVAHLAKDGTVLHVATMPPGRLGKLVWRSCGVLEAESGSFDAWGLVRGGRVQVTSPAGAV